MFGRPQSPTWVGLYARHSLPLRRPPTIGSTHPTADDPAVRPYLH